MRQVGIEVYRFKTKYRFLMLLTPLTTKTAPLLLANIYSIILQREIKSRSSLTNHSIGMKFMSCGGLIGVFGEYQDFSVFLVELEQA